uniref:Uncharacterized protein n=1 Tax=Romanomermis culicivorax TaxID=13658 RepID=A0A915HR22_ROMCU
MPVSFVLWFRISFRVKTFGLDSLVSADSLDSLVSADIVSALTFPASCTTNLLKHFIYSKDSLYRLKICHKEIRPINESKGPKAKVPACSQQALENQLGDPIKDIIIPIFYQAWLLGYLLPLINYMSADSIQQFKALKVPYAKELTDVMYKITKDARKQDDELVTMLEMLPFTVE